MNLRPTEGARFLLERIDEEGGSATYRATIFVPDAEHSVTARLDDDGTVEIPATGAPPALDDALAVQVRLLARGAAKRAEDGLVKWPARVLRWRGPGRGTV